MSDKVIFEREGDVAVFFVNNPPINAGSVEVRTGLLEAIRLFGSDETLQAAVIVGAGSTFIAGSDLREFGKPLQEPQLPAIIAAIEACPKPVIAALHGSALGGGFEIALGCDARIALAGTLVGLPEVTLGIIPGAGGTQRLPRIVGVARAITLICSGERVSSSRARALGLIDIEVTGDLLSASVQYARNLHGVKARVRDRIVPIDSADELQTATRAAIKAGKDRPAVHACIDAIQAASIVPFDEGLAFERRLFQSLRTSREAFALRHLFFAERDAAKQSALQSVSARNIQSVAVIGAGTMGTGIVIAALDAGLRVALIEQDEVALKRGVTRIRDHYSKRVQAGKLKPEVAIETVAKLQSTMDWALLAQADVVIEAVFEDLAVKLDVFRKIDKYAQPRAVLASNTSYLDLDSIARATGRTHAVLGLHFFSPAHVMRLLEVVRGQDTAPDVLATGISLAKLMRKMPVITGNSFGFIGNRIYSAYRRQCEFMLEEGAYPEDVDAALEKFGFAMGPFSVADLSGLDIAWRMRNAMAAQRNPMDRYVHIPDHLCEAGRLGQKTGSGYYRYDASGGSRQIDGEVRAIIDAASTAKGVIRRTLDAEEICRRALLSMVNEAALLLAEGVAQRASDVDVVLVNGYGFPRWEGGPIFWAQARGRELLQLDLVWLAQCSGAGFVCGDLSYVLK